MKPKDIGKEKEIQSQISAVRRELEKVNVGNELLIETLLLAVMSGGSVLAAGPPGGGKSLATDSLARALNLSSARIDFTPDLMPSGIVGYWDAQNREINFGPIFNQVIRAEEITRAPAKTKSTLLGLMQEATATIEGVPKKDGSAQLFPLPQPHFILATLNPFEMEGQSVYPLGRAELDRFDFYVEIEQKTVNQLAAIIVTDSKRRLKMIEPVLDPDQVIDIISYVRDQSDLRDQWPHTIDPIVYYIAMLAHDMGFIANHSEKEHQASERAARSLYLALTAYRVIEGIDYLMPEHVRKLVKRSWVHRIIAEDMTRAEEILDETIRFVSPIPIPKSRL